VSFAVNGSSEFDKIIFRKNSNTVELTLVDNAWYYNNKYFARQQALSMLFSAMSVFQVSSPLSGNARTEVLQALQKDPITVQVFAKDKMIKEYSICDCKYGTAMMMSHSSDPFIIEVPNFNGKVTALFRFEEVWWRDRTLFKYQPNQILSVSVEFPYKPQSSFRLLNYGENRFGIKPYKADKLITDAKAESIQNYLLGFRDVAYEKILPHSDSMIHLLQEKAPDYIFSLKNTYSNETHFCAYPMMTDHSKDKTDPNLFYLIINNKDLAVGKYVVFDPLVKEIDYFRKKTSLE
jgi:hypothetical protein